MVKSILYGFRSKNGARGLVVMIVACQVMDPGFYQLSYKRTSEQRGPCGLMDKALPSGGRDCGFESRLGLHFFKSSHVADSMAQWQRVGFQTRRLGVRGFDSLWGQRGFFLFAHSPKKNSPKPGIEPGSPA